MTKYKQMIRKIFIYGLIFASCVNLCACDPGKDRETTHKKPTIPSRQIWSRLRRNFEIAPKQNQSQKQRVEKYVKKYAKQEKALTKLSSEATPYLYYIVEQLEKRNMPGEIALLPMIESAFQPHATSRQGAAGLWQFIPSTGRLYGLKQDAWYDGRHDIKASTEAALNYLSFLHQEFDENWMLALAAYNAGEGAVRRAIQRNKRLGKPITFWDLNLPKETKEYVPKLLALAEVIRNADIHAISLAPIADKPYFVAVNPGTHLNFQQAAKLADIHIKELKRLNAGYRRATTHPKGPQEILLPIANAEKFAYNRNLTKKR